MSLKPIFYPKNVAIIGASRERGKLGHNVVENLLKGGFKGQIYPIKPSGENILGFPFRIFRIVIVKTTLGNNLNDR